MTARSLAVGFEERARLLFRESLRKLQVDTDRLFAGLMAIQWIFAIICALVISPRTWMGAASEIHVHVHAAVFLGGLLAGVPIWLAIRHPGEAATRYSIALSQALFSALLIHLTGGRIETHFHVFGSLAFLAFYRCWKTIAIATTVIALDHLLRGVFWPQSVFGVTGASSLRWLEHFGWVVFEDVVLLISIRRGLSELRVAARRRAELEATNEHIEDVVVQRTRELEEARDAALDATRAKSEFLANMSHEIRTPMNGVLGFVHLLRETELSSTQRQFVTTIEHSGQSLLTILNDILDFSKVEAGQMELEELPFRPAEVMMMAGQLLAATADAKGLEFVCRTRAVEGLHAIGDPTRLQQVLLNLCGNAIKFTEEGEVELDAEVTRLDAEHVRLSFVVRDTGIGIPEERVPHLFNAFEQVDGSITRRFGGTGLGLSISQSLVEAMDGTVEVSSEPDVGSVFRAHVTLRAGSAPDTAGPSLEGRRVLVVDDNETNRRLLEEALGHTGAVVVSAASAGDALALLDQEAPRFEVALLDQHMPEMDGLELAARIRAHPVYSELPLVLLSSVMARDRTELNRLGFLWHQFKPVHIGPLLERLSTALGGEADDAAGEARPATVQDSPSGLRVLLAEDNAVNRKVGTALLERLGNRVTVAVDGLEAVREFSEGEFDLILMDAQMPNMDGLAASAEIRRIEATTGARPIRIVAVTAHVMPGYRDVCLENGMDDYLTKPIDPRELERVLSDAGAAIQPAPHA